jgi:hypothetical protein
MKTFYDVTRKLHEGSVFTENGIAWMVIKVQMVRGLGKMLVPLITADVIVNYR